ncbi:nuclease-related domain-containing protein [Nocardioides pantholopis]|uniref:nuclease-related domain-containing protein n=1 Tax=Nocardioides pantholopis TaxID=2483798 RepID=UPI000FD9B416|nr:nuclease-related domain-containing protein [Nocardioides pantholopis]
MPTPPADRPPVTRTAAQQAARDILRIRPLGERALRAALKAQRVDLSLEQVADVLSDDQFVLGGDGRWRLAERTIPAADFLAWRSEEPIARLTYPELTAALAVSELEIRELLPVLARLRPDVDWLALDRRLRTGAAVAVRNSSVEAIRESLASLPVSRAKQTGNQQPVTGQAPRPIATELTTFDEQRRTEDAAAQAARSKLEAQLRAAEDERNAAQLARQRAECTVRDLVRERQTEIVERARRIREADEAKQRATAEIVQNRRAKRMTSSALTRPIRKTLLGWEQTDVGWVYEVGAPTTEGERELKRQLRNLPGIVVLNCYIWDGAKEREVDAVVIHPRGIVTIEQKDVGRTSTGLLTVPVNGPVTVGGHEVGHDRARQQARLSAQMLASVSHHEPKLEVGFITAFLAFHGDLELEPQLQRGNVRICMTKTVAGTLENYFSARESTVTLTVAQGVLRRLEVPGAGDGRFATLGFHVG